MKRFLAVILSVITLLSCAACGAPADTTVEDDTLPTVTDAPETNAPETNAPETNAPETNVPETDDSFEVPGDPAFNEDYDPDAEVETDQKDMIFEFDFSTPTETGAGEKFQLDFSKWEQVTGENGYLKNSSYNGMMFVKDNELALVGKSFMFELDVTFDVLPFKADGVTNFPLSVMTWTRTTSAGDTYYDWAFKLDDEGYIYVKDTSTRTNFKIETNKKYTFGVYFDDENRQLMVYLDGTMVGTKNYSAQKVVESSLRLFDSGSNKGHFNAKLHATRAYFSDGSDVLTDAERDVFTAVNSVASPELCFVAYTDKDALSYKVGEEMSFEIYLMCNGEVVSAPYFYYTVKGEDGQTKTEGYADGSKGHFTVKAKMSKPGAVRVEAYVCNENKVKQTKNNSKLFQTLATAETADLCFRGGAIAGFEQITAGGKIPTDLKEYWNGVVADCYKGDIKLLRFDEVDPTAYGKSSSTYSLYLVEIECEGGFATGYLSIPKGKSSLGINYAFVSYGNTKKPTPSFNESYAVFKVCAHSYHLDDPNAAAPSRYGFDNTENQNRDTVYFKNMFIRNVTVARFLKAYIGDGSYGKIVYNGETVAPLNKWKAGDSYVVSGGSQGSFQAVAMAALDSDVTRASFSVPWFCDIGGDLVGRFDGWNPDYTDALMYYDCCALATLIEDDVKVTIDAGLGDTTSEPSGVVALYNALNCNATMTMTQNREHTYNPPISKSYLVSKD